ncbi:MAG: ATP-binding protein [Chthoniobacteraceae bacterium]
MSDAASFKVDLTNCDREPIHIPGSVQAHAVMLVLAGDDLLVSQATSNTAARLGIACEQLLGQPVEVVIGEEMAAHLRSKIVPQLVEAVPQYLPPVIVGAGGQRFEALIHRYQGALILELEAWDFAESTVTQDTYGGLRNTIGHLQGTCSIEDFCQLAAEHVRRFIGFDRVMVYRFAEDDSGHVVAESRREDLESYLGLHYPAADIPKQARELFKRSQLRLNPDVHYTPVPLLPTARADTGTPLDMSYCVTRSMSPIHAEYLKNMGVDASMSISIVVDDRLWGLFACHHYAPRYVSHSARMACEFLAHLLSLQMGGKESAGQSDYTIRLAETHVRLVEKMASAPDFLAALLDGERLGGLQCAGAAVLFNGEVHRLGRTPEPAQLLELATWLAREVPEEVWSTNELGRHYPPATGQAPVAAGLIAARLSRRRESYLLWFEPEETQTVNWAGDPHKAVVASGPNGDRLTPRKSFALWKESVQGRSRTWLACEVAAARTLRHSVLEIIVRHAEELVALNAELQRRNQELDSFAYVASHDLKEPLRGIHNYTQFLLEDYAEKLEGDGKAQLETVRRLSSRMTSLLDALLYYSRMGRATLAEEKIKLDAVLADSLELLHGRLQETGAQIRVPRPLPEITADPVRITEVFTNLISNALKYNDQPEKWVEIGWEEAVEAGEPVAFYVRDNGIGIAEEHYEVVFRIFKRLHLQTEYSGGSGTGLAIVRQIVERHGGKIWVESKVGEGSSFRFTLSGALEADLPAV